MKEIIIGAVCFMAGAGSGFVVFALCATAKKSDCHLEFDDYEILENEENE